MGNGRDYTHHLKDAVAIVESTPAKTVQAMLLAHGTCNAEKITALEKKAAGMTDENLAAAIKRDQPKQAIQDVVRKLPEIKWLNKGIIVGTVLAIIFQDEIVAWLKRIFA